MTALEVYAVAMPAAITAVCMVYVWWQLRVYRLADEKEARRLHPKS